MTGARHVDVALLQIRARPGAVEDNLARLLDLLRTHGETADLVVAPELATTGYDLELLGRRGAELAEPVDGPSLKALAGVCADVGTTMMVGFLEDDGGTHYDSVATLTPDRAVSTYRKTHLYPAEAAHFAEGTTLCTVPTPAGVLGPMLCFEHAFPEIATALALRGAQLLVIPSAVPIGFEHLITLRSRARAQDNQVFVLACNLAGDGFCGHSLIADPRGVVLAEAGDEETVLRARIDLGAVERERSVEPALRLRRPDLYGGTDERG